jgi:hypothetical protein
MPKERQLFGGGFRESSPQTSRTAGRGTTRRKDEIAAGTSIYVDVNATEAVPTGFGEKRSGLVLMSLPGDYPIQTKG